MSSEQPIYDLFLSYAASDANWAHDWLLPRLEAAGLRVLTPDAFDLGVAELVNLERAVVRSRHTLLILTPAWVADPWRNFEALLLQTQDPAGLLYRRTLPLLLQLCTPPRHLAMLSYADLTAPAQQEAQLARVVAAARGELRLPEVGPPLARLLGPSVSACYQLRAPVGDFVGRTDEIDRLVSALSATNADAVAIGGIRGMGGVGKSQLAYAVARRIAPTFPDAQLLVNLRGVSDTPLTALQALQAIIRVFEPEARLPDDLDQLQALYLSLLTGRRVLILADDAKDTDQVQCLVPPPGCGLLVTSRNYFGVPGMAWLDLGTLPPEEAEKLLLSVCRRIGEYAAKLANLCGYLPLALRVSATLLETNESRDVAQYLEQLEVERLKHLTDAEKPDDPQASVEASLRLSYAALAPMAESALCQMSVFPTSFDLDAAKAIIVVEGDIAEVLELLGRRSLLEWNAALERYSLHDLVRAFGIERLVNVDAIRMRHAQYYTRVAGRARELYLQGGAEALAGLALFDQERPHIDSGWRWTLAHTGSPQVAALLLAYTDATVEIGDLRYNIGAERIQPLDAALAAAHRTADRSAEVRILNSLGLSYRELGDAQNSIVVYEQALVIARTIGDQQGEQEALFGLGNIYGAFWRDYHRAIQYFEKQLAIACAIGDRREECDARNGLAGSYLYLGDIRRAIEYYEEALEIAREIGNRRNEARSLGNLGIAYSHLGDAQRAIEYYEQALGIAHELHDRIYEWTNSNNLGNVYRKQGNTSRAIEYYEQALNLARGMGSRSEEASTSWSLGLALEQQGNLVRAAELMQFGIEYLREIGDPDAEPRAALLDQLRQRLASQSPSPAASQDLPQADDTDEG